MIAKELVDNIDSLRIQADKMEEQLATIALSLLPRFANFLDSLKEEMSKRGQAEKTYADIVIGSFRIPAKMDTESLYECSEFVDYAGSQARSLAFRIPGLMHSTFYMPVDFVVHPDGWELYFTELIEQGVANHVPFSLSDKEHSK